MACSLTYTVEFLGYIFVAVNSMHFAPNAAVLCEITHNDCHWAVQGHSRSAIVISIESQYMRLAVSE